MNIRPILSAVLAGLLATSARAGIDLNGNVYDDVWEQFYQAGALALDADEDGDGRSNRLESLAGTDPRDPISSLRIVALAPGADELVVSWSSVLGKSYRVQVSPDLATWSDAAAPAVAGTGATMQAAFSVTDDIGFCRVSARDVDSDGDGATDFEELVARFDPANPQSHTPGQSDLVSLTAALAATTSTLQVAVIAGRAYEVNAAATGVKSGTLRLVRSGALSALTAAFTTSGRPVAGTDFVAFAGTAPFPFGVNAVDVAVTPLADAHLEVPETLTVTLAPGAGYLVGAAANGAVRIDDFETQVETFYYCQLSPQAGVNTTASGFATLFLSGDHTTLRTSVNFANLTSGQPVEDAAHLHYVPTREHVHDLSAGQIVNDVWTLPVEGVGSLASDQAILDALTSQQLYVNIHTLLYPNGEIRGDFRPASGSIDFTPPPAPPALPTYTGTELDRDVQRFLSQATFGQTDALFAQVKASGLTAWLDAQLDPAQTPRTVLLDFVKAQDDWSVAKNNAAGGPGTFEPRFFGLINGWWNIAARAPDQLRQRTASALSEILVVSINNTDVRNHHYGTADYYDALARNAFGNFRTLLEDVSKHPIMATYLSSLKNEKFDAATNVSPDENYAREVMQLFSIGLVELHPDGSLRLDAATGQPIATYNNTHIQQLARVFTGWSYSRLQSQGFPLASNWNNDGAIQNNPLNGNPPNFGFYARGSLNGPYAQAAWYSPLINFPAYHEPGAKNIVGVNIPAGGTGESDLDSAMDALFHHANTGPFIARRLIQRLITSTPSNGYIYRVAQVFADDGAGVRGNLGAVVRAILTDYEARNQDLMSQPGYGKLREPLLRATQIYRALSVSTGIPMSEITTLSTPAWTSPFPAGSTLLRPTEFAEQLGQGPLAAPSVFNWFHPDFTVPGAIANAGLYAPEFEITNEVQVVNYTNLVSSFFWDANGVSPNVASQRGAMTPGYNANQSRLVLNLAAARAAFTAGGSTGLIVYLDALFCHSAMSSATRTQIRTAVDGIGANGASNATEEKVRNALYLVLTSPDYLVQR